MEHQYSHDRLIRAEIATLIGLMIQRPIDLSLPTSETIQNYIDRTESLLQELHQSMMKPWCGNRDLNADKISVRNPFESGAAMREPIFYGDESAYDFQYKDLACQKYLADEEWFETNKGFRIQEACNLTDVIGRLQTTRQIKCAASFRRQPPDQWTILPGFMFTTQDVADASGFAIEKIERFLNAFSCGPDEHNTSFTALNEFNITNAAPILKISEGTYILLQHYSLREAVYESPYFWMFDDKAYSPIALTNRGRFTERFVADRLEAVFGTSRVLRNVDIYKGKNRFAEADALVLYGDRAIIVQAKSKRLTIEARKGNDRRLKDDFKKAIQDAYDQTLLCADALGNDGFRFIDQSGDAIVIESKPRIIFPICILADHYPALAFQARQFLSIKTNKVVKPPLVLDVFTLDVIVEMLSSPLHLLNYLSLRARFDEKLIVSHELTILGFHLKYNLWFDDKYTSVMLGEDCAGALDIAMQARRGGWPGKRVPDGILTRFDNLPIGRLLTEIERIASPQVIGLGLSLLQLNSQTAKLLNSGINRIVSAAKRDGGNHDISVAVNPGNAGITIHCNGLPEKSARERLSTHCKVRKYDVRANAWYGLLLDPATGGIRAALVIEEDWRPDSQMDEVMAVWSKRSPASISELGSKPKKIGRNDPCPCGSGRKFKKCCLKI